MAIGDMLFSLMGQEDPRKQLAAALAQAQNPTPQPLAQNGAMAPGSPGAPTTAPVAGSTGAGQPGQPPQAPPQPQAYTSPPDLVSLYTKLADRQQANEGINRGLGLLLGAFAKPQDRAGMMSAMENTQPDASSLINNSVALQQQQLKMGQDATTRANLPELAAKLGIDMPTAQALLASGKLDDYIAEQSKPTPAMQNYKEYVKNQQAAGQPAIDFATFMRTAGATPERLGLNPVWQTKTDADGNMTVQAFQLGDRGTLHAIKDDNGNTISVKPVQINRGTSVDFVNPYTQEVLKSVPIDNFNKARDAAMGGKEGAAAQQLSMGDEAVKQGTAIIDRILSSGDTADNAGFRSWFMPLISSSAGKTANDIDQLKSINFLQAYTQLRGAGNISDAEGIKAQSAFANLQHPERLSDADFRANLTIARQAMLDANEAAHKSAGDPGGGVKSPDPNAGGSTTPPDVAAILQKYKKKAP